MKYTFVFAYWPNSSMIILAAVKWKAQTSSPIWRESKSFLFTFQLPFVYNFNKFVYNYLMGLFTCGNDLAWW